MFSGFYSSGGSENCTQCTAGKSCTDPTDTSPGDCPAGTYSIMGDASCTNCVKGKYSECLESYSGFFSSEYFMLACSQSRNNATLRLMSFGCGD